MKKDSVRLHLQTKTKLPITNAEDIERYVDGLRQQLERLTWKPFWIINSRKQQKVYGHQQDKTLRHRTRNILKVSIAAKVMILGSDKKGRVVEKHRTQLMLGGIFWNWKLFTEGFCQQCNPFFNRIQPKGNQTKEKTDFSDAFCCFFQKIELALLHLLLDSANADRNLSNNPIRKKKSEYEKSHTTFIIIFFVLHN